MAVKKPVKPKSKLPDRYPRNSEIVLFEDMSELDIRFENLDEMVEHLLELPNDLEYDVLSQSWKAETEYYLRAYLSNLRKAYLEYERFYQPNGWSINDDSLLNDDLSNAGDFNWRLEEFRQKRLIDIPERFIEGSNTIVPARISRCYEPAQHACAEAIYLVLFLMQIPTDNDHLKDIGSRLQYWLTRYYAATLEVVYYRNSVYLSSIRPHVLSAQKSQKAAQENADNQKAEAYKLSVTLANRVHELTKGSITKTNAVSKVSAEYKCAKSRVWTALRDTKNHSSQG